MTTVRPASHFGLPLVIGLIGGLCLLAGCSEGVAVRGPVKAGVTSQADDGIPVASAGASGGGTVLVRVWPQGIETKIKKVVAKYQVELIPNLPGDGGMNAEGVPSFKSEAGKGHNDYSTATAVTSYLMPASSESLMVRFTDVAPGTYRARVKALDAGGANVSWPLAPMGPAGSEQMGISMNAVTVVNATINLYRNTYPNGGSDQRLDCPIQALTTDKE